MPKDDLDRPHLWPNATGVGFSPMTNNIVTMTIGSSNTHHCTANDKKGHAVSRQCFFVHTNHLGFCCHPITVDKNGVIRVRWCGYKIKIESTGCTRHECGKCESNLFLRDAARGRPHEMPKLIPHDIEGYYDDPEHPGVPIELWNSLVREAERKLAEEAKEAGDEQTNEEDKEEGDPEEADDEDWEGFFRQQKLEKKKAKDKAKEEAGLRSSVAAPKATKKQKLAMTAREYVKTKRSPKTDMQSNALATRKTSTAPVAEITLLIPGPGLNGRVLQNGNDSTVIGPQTPPAANALVTAPAQPRPRARQSGPGTQPLQRQAMANANISATNRRGGPQGPGTQPLLRQAIANVNVPTNRRRGPQAPGRALALPATPEKMENDTEPKKDSGLGKNDDRKKKKGGKRKN